MTYKHVRALAELFELKLAQTPISKQEYDAIRTTMKAKNRGKDPIAVRPGRQGGGVAGVPINQYNVELATFNGLVDTLVSKINTAIHSARLGVTQEKSEGGKKHNALKPYVDALSKAIQNGDTQAKYQAIRALKQQAIEWSSRAPAIRALEKSVRLLPHFNKLKDNFKLIGSWQEANQNWNLTEEQMSFVVHAIRNAERLTQIYKQHYDGAGIRLFYGKALESLQHVIARLKKETNVQ